MSYSIDPTFMVATIYAAQGVMDQLISFFEQAIEQPGIDMRGSIPNFV